MKILPKVLVLMALALPAGAESLPVVTLSDAIAAASENNISLKQAAISMNQTIRTIATRKDKTGTSQRDPEKSTVIFEVFIGFCIFGAKNTKIPGYSGKKSPFSGKKAVTLPHFP